MLIDIRIIILYALKKYFQLSSEKEGTEEAVFFL